MKKVKNVLMLVSLFGMMGCNDELVTDVTTSNQSNKDKEFVETFLRKKAPQAQKN